MRFVDINPTSDIEFGSFNNKKMSICLNECMKPVKFQIPRMYMPFGISGFTPEVGATKYNIDFSMKGWDEEGGYVKKFYNFVKDVEDNLISEVVKQSPEIMGAQMSAQEIKSMLNSNIKQGTDRDPKFRLKVGLESRIFDVNDTDVTCPLEHGLYSKHSGVAMVEMNGVYFLNRMIGITWKLTQMKIYEPQRLKGFQFQLENNDADY